MITSTPAAAHRCASPKPSSPVAPITVTRSTPTQTLLYTPPARSIRRLVLAEHLAQNVRHLAQGGVGSERLAHRIQEVVGAARRLLERFQRRVHCTLVTVPANSLRALDLSPLKLRIELRDLHRLLVVDGESVHTHNHSLAGLDVLSDSIG